MSETDDLIALRQIEPPYDWRGWSETADEIRELPEKDNPENAPEGAER